MPPIPELEHHCGSWIITSRETGKAVFETFKRAIAERVNQEKYRVETALQYLGRINAEIRERESQC